MTENNLQEGSLKTASPSCDYGYSNNNPYPRSAGLRNGVKKEESGKAKALSWKGVAEMTSGSHGELGDRALFLSKIMVNILAEALINAGAHGISAPQFRILDIINNGVDNPGQLAAMLDVSPPAVSLMVARLEDAGLILRQHAKFDRRRVILLLTEKGASLVDEVNGNRKRMIEAVLENMEEVDAEVLDTAMRAFAKSYLELKENQQRIVNA